MDGSRSTEGRVALGDPVPWFSAPLATGGSVDLHVDAGRWVVLAFLGSLDEPRAAHELAEILKEVQHFDESRLVVYGVLTNPPDCLDLLASISSPALSFIADYDGAISRAFGALGAPRSVVLDPMLRAIADIGWDHPGNHTETLRHLIRELPDVDHSAGEPLTAPVLLVPRVFDFEFCDHLVALFDHLGSSESGFMIDQDGMTRTIIDHRLKSRRDLVITDPDLRQTMRDRLVRRLVPAIERFFQFKATRLDRYMVCCYDSDANGHFFRHRDNLNAGAQHRRFAVSINLNKDFDGGEVVFPEFGRRGYRPPAGGAAVFSCGMLHEVTPVTRGRRLVFVPFLYGEEDALVRERNNALLAAGEAHYVAGYDRLFPAAAGG